MSSFKRCGTMMVLAGSLLAGPAMAADGFPTRPITLVVPFSAGGAFDIVARMVAERLGGELGQSVVVENKPGAGGTLGGRQVSQARPDGYTLLLSGVGPMSIAPAVYKNLGYDPVQALAPVTQLTSSPLVLAVSDAFKGQTVGEFVDFLKGAPGKYNYASTGNGTIVHLAGVYFTQQTGTEAEHVPYSGGGQMSNSLLAGDTQFTITNIPNVLGQIQAGRLRALATTGTSRPAVFADKPTMQEAGFAGFELTGWVGIFAPAGTPASVVEKLNAGFVTVMQNPEMKARLVAQGDGVVASSVAAFQQFVADSAAQWKRIAQSANISID